MPTRLELIEDGHIIDSALIAPWTLEDLYAAWREEETLRRGSAHTIHAILDISHARPAPRGLVSQLRRSPALSHYTKGQIVIVGGSVFARAVLDIAMKITKHREIHFMESRDDALKYLRGVISRELDSAGSAG